jgi:hypothetical protein
VNTAGTVPKRQVRAQFDENSIIVYQAYPPEVAEPAIAAGTFVPPFKPGRMTWIKPSFLWMMYRSGWAGKPGQERVLAVRMSRPGFDWALANAVLSSHESSAGSGRAEWEKSLRSSAVRLQWDPERSLTLQPLPWRAIQIGLSGEASDRYVGEWIMEIRDVTPLVHQIHGLVTAGDHDAARALLTVELPYELPESVQAMVGATQE